MRVVIIVQARMNSSRLPGKVLKRLSGRPVLAHIQERLSQCRLADEIVVATSKESSDNIIEEFCVTQNLPCFRGSLDDVLDRLYNTAREHSADAIVRITGDCPLIDPVVVDAVILAFLAGKYDCYGLGGEFPDGLDCTAFSFKAIERAWKEACLPSEREHVGPYIENNPHIFKNGALRMFSGLGSYRLTLDEPQDFELLSEIFDALYTPGRIFSVQEVIQLMHSRPELRAINASIQRNEGYMKSLLAEGKDRNDGP